MESLEVTIRNLEKQLEERESTIDSVINENSKIVVNHNKTYTDNLLSKIVLQSLGIIKLLKIRQLKR